MKPQVSIIVPIYNMEQYISRCLDSLLAQELQEIEILAINDGSTDRSPEIVEQYANKDARIIVVHQANQGVSAARNTGVQLAKGEYIGFVDPDDWVDKEMYGKMLQEAKLEDADVVMCSYIREFGTHAKVKQYELKDRAVFVGDEVKQRILRRIVGPIHEEVASPESLDAWGTVWSKIYRRSMLQDNKLAFIDLKQIGTNEDSLFNIHALYYAQKFIFINQPFYHYWRISQASQTSHYRPHLLQQWLVLYSLIEQFLHEKQLSPSFNEALMNRICLGTLGLGLNEISKTNRASMLIKIKALKSMLSDEKIQGCFKGFEASYCPAVWKVFYLFAKNQFATGFFAMLQAIEFLRKRRS